MRPWVSVAGTRCTRCTPLSNFSRAKTPLPSISADRALHAAEVALVVVQHLEAPALRLGVALVGAEQLGGEQRRLVAAGGGADLQDGAALVGGVAAAAASGGSRAPARQAVLQRRGIRPRPAPASRGRPSIASASSRARFGRAVVPAPSDQRLESDSSLESVAELRRRRRCSAAWRELLRAAAAAGPACCGQAHAQQAPRQRLGQGTRSPACRHRGRAAGPRPRAASSSPRISAARAPMLVGALHAALEVALVGDLRPHARRGAAPAAASSAARLLRPRPPGSRRPGARRGGGASASSSIARRSTPAAQPTEGVGGPPISSTSPS